jgi:protein arginine kinase
MTLEELLDHPCAWFVDHAPGEIAISSRIRLARNLAGFPFPARASGSQKNEIREHLMDVLRATGPFETGLLASSEDVTPFQRQLLFERSLISREHAELDEGGAIAVSRDEQDVVMINEEDHLRLQVVRSGLSLMESWDEMMRLDDALDDRVDYAFAEPYGFLTCCPSNTGTGMRAGVMLHLPGLALMDEIRPVMRGLGKMGLAVRGLGGEGSEADGFLFQISNQITLGRTEEDILEELNGLVEELIRHELNARARLAENRPNGLRDKVGRAVGVLQNAWELQSKEALDMLSLVRLGLAMDLLKLDKPRVIEQLMVEVRPCHLQKLAEKDLNPSERDRFRAEWVRSKLADLSKGPKL